MIAALVLLLDNNKTRAHWLINYKIRFQFFEMHGCRLTPTLLAKMVESNWAKTLLANTLYVLVYSVTQIKKVHNV